MSKHAATPVPWAGWPTIPKIGGSYRYLFGLEPSKPHKRRGIAAKTRRRERADNTKVQAEDWNP